MAADADDDVGIMLLTIDIGQTNPQHHRDCNACHEALPEFCHQWRRRRKEKASQERMEAMQWQTGAPQAKVGSNPPHP